MKAERACFKGSAVAVLVTFCLLGLFPSKSAATTLGEVKEKAIIFLYREFLQKGAGREGGGIDTYIFYLLREAGVDTGSWKHKGKSLEEAVRESIERDIAVAKKLRAKYLAQDLLAARLLGATDLADLLLKVLKERESPQGLEDVDALSVYSNIPAHELLGRAGLLDSFNQEWAKKYLLERQRRGPGPAQGSWGSGEGQDYYPDFMATAQAVRALHYLDPQRQDARVQAAIKWGLEWMKRQQRPDGSFLAGMDDPVIDTAEAVLTLKLLGFDPDSWKSGQGRSPVDYLRENAINPDGSFGTCGNAMDAAWVLAACLTLKEGSNNLVTKPSPGQGEESSRQTQPGAGKAFKDLNGHWAEGAIYRLVQMQVVSGYPDGYFRPDVEVSRYELAAMVVRLLKPQPATRHDLFVLRQKFADASSIPLWAMESVAVALREGLMSGYPQPGGGLVFRGEEALTRAELAAVTARIIRAKCEGVVPRDLDFSDASEIPAWAREAVGVVYARKVVSGYPDGTFQPHRKVNRAEAAAVFLRLAEAIGTAK